MRVLLLGPDHDGGSLPPYLDAVTTGLRHHGVRVDRRGSSQIPYDTDRERFWSLQQVVAAARELDDALDLDTYDLVALHSGNLEYDQLLPALWARDQRRRPPVVWHVHTLDATLLREHIPAPDWDRQVIRAARSADGHVYFGHYGRQQYRPADHTAPQGVAWLPTTIPAGTTPKAHPALTAALTTDLPVISLYGYAAPWKSADLLHAAAARMQVPARIVLAGDFWNDPDQAGTDLTTCTHPPTRVGAGEFVVVPGYLGPADRAALVRASTAGVFPYRAHPSFQGSGALADYLAAATPVVATDVANMAELVGDAGHIVSGGDPSALAAGLDLLASGTTTATRRARGRAPQFRPEAHAQHCLAVYQQVLDHRRCA